MGLPGGQKIKKFMTTSASRLPKASLCGSAWGLEAQGSQPMAGLPQQGFELREHVGQQDLQQPIAQMGHKGLALQQVQQISHAAACHPAVSMHCRAVQCLSVLRKPERVQCTHLACHGMTQCCEDVMPGFPTAAQADESLSESCMLLHDTVQSACQARALRQAELQPVLHATMPSACSSGSHQFCTG